MSKALTLSDSVATYLAGLRARHTTSNDRRLRLGAPPLQLVHCFSEGPENAGHAGPDEGHHGVLTGSSSTSAPSSTETQGSTSQTINGHPS